MVCWANLEGFHYLPEGRGGSRGFTMVCWTAGADPEGLPCYSERQGRIQKVSIVRWKAGADPEGLPWYAGRQGRIQRVHHGMLEGRHGSRGFTMV